MSAAKAKTPQASKGPEASKAKGPEASKAKGPGAAKAQPPKEKLEPRLRILYREKIVPALREEFGYTSVMQVPRLVKVVLSMGLGDAIQNKKLLDSALKEMTQIAGLKAVRTRARKSIAGFKIREGMEIGAKVTLRGEYMWEFLDRLINVAIPRVKDFRGTSPNAFDGHGNYSLGITEQIIFPEIDYDQIERVSGLNVTIVTTARTDAEARSLLARLGMPFRKTA
jgi:large subunit ribosomal protein L5